MTERDQHRFEDAGIARMIKYWPFLALIFTAGAWYETSKANAMVVEKVQNDISETRTRVTRVEDAVLYLKEIVKEDRRGHGR